jgi:tetratricopeptide (TPR) repeat protein
MLQPGYKLARENLGIAFNNRGLSERKDFQSALKDFHRAILINPDDATVEKNVETLLASKGRSSNNFDALKELADDAFNKKDYVGALVEYRRALTVKDDMNAQARIAEIVKFVLAKGAKFSDFSGTN